MDSLSFPSRPLQKPRCPSIESATYFVRSFFFFFLFPLFFFFFFFYFSFHRVQCCLYRILSSFILKISSSTSITSLSFGGKRPSSIQQRFKKFSPPLPSPPISRSRRPALSSIARCPVRMTDLNDRLTLINYSYRQL